MFARKLVVVALVAQLSGVASADRERAKAAYKVGIQHYNLAEYAEALESFKQAYREYEEPTLLFNIGQCHRQLSHKKEAVTFYRSYLREVPDAENRDEVRRLMAAVEKEVAAEQVVRPTLPSLAPTPDPVVVSSTPAISSPQQQSKQPAKRRLWIVGVVVGTVAAAALGIGLGVGLGGVEQNPSPSWGMVKKN